MKTAYIFGLKGNEAYHFKLPGARMPAQQFYGTNGDVIGEVHGNNVSVYAPYKWNGCTPRYQVTLFGSTFNFGAPNGRYMPHMVSGRTMWKPALYYATLEHDFIWQFRPEGVTLEQSNDLFQQHMRRVGWPLRRLYSWIVDTVVKFKS